MDRTKSEMESGLSWLFAEAFIWKCERELLSAEERSRGKKLALGLTDEMQDFQDEAVLCVAPRSGRSFQANGYSVVCPRILTMDLENRIDWCGATIQLQHVWTRSDSGFVLLSDPSVAEATRVEAK